MSCSDPGRRGLKVVSRDFTGPVGLEGTLQFPMKAYPGEAKVCRKYHHLVPVSIIRGASSLGIRGIVSSVGSFEC